MVEKLRLTLLIPKLQRKVTEKNGTLLVGTQIYKKDVFLRPKDSLHIFFSCVLILHLMND